MRRSRLFISALRAVDGALRVGLRLCANQNLAPARSKWLVSSLPISFAEIVREVSFCQLPRIRAAASLRFSI